MSDDSKIYREQRGYQPGKDDLTKGYRPTQALPGNLTIPSNLGDAAVTPVDNNRPAPAPTGSEKK